MSKLLPFKLLSFKLCIIMLSIIVLLIFFLNINFNTKTIEIDIKWTEFNLDVSELQYRDGLEKISIINDKMCFITSEDKTCYDDLIFRDTKYAELAYFSMMQTITFNGDSNIATLLAVNPDIDNYNYDKYTPFLINYINQYLLIYTKEQGEHKINNIAWNLNKK